MRERATIRLGQTALHIDDVVALADGRARVSLSNDPDYERRLEASLSLLRRALAEGQPIYGVSTGFGDSCEVAVPENEIRRLPVNLVRFHGCGTGARFSERECA